MFEDNRGLRPFQIIIKRFNGGIVVIVNYRHRIFHRLMAGCRKMPDDLHFVAGDRVRTVDNAIGRFITLDQGQRCPNIIGWR